MTTMRWDPLGELNQLQERINRVFTDAYGSGTGRRSDEGLMSTGAWAPPVDIYEDPNHQLVIKVELPDITPGDIQLSVDNNTLTIKGERRFTTEVKEDQFHRIERRYGPFSRSFSLPHIVDTGKIAAEQKNGVLTIRLPLRDEAKPRQIKVDVTD